MTSERFTFTSIAIGGSDYTAYWNGLVASLDADRAPFGIVTLTFKGVPTARRAGLDPRRTAGLQVQLWLSRDDLDKGTTTFLPGSSAGIADDLAQMTLWAHEYRFNKLSDEITLECRTGEQRMMDRDRIATNVADTAAGSLAALVRYALDNTFGAGTYTLTDNVSSSSVALPAGDRRLHQPSESYWDLVEGELNAQGWRLYCDLTGAWVLASRTAPPRPTSPALLNAATDNTPCDIIVTGATQTLSREGWADSAVAKYTYTNASGAQVVSYQASANGSKGTSVEYSRAPSSSNLAAGIRSRALKRGSAYEVTGQINFKARPGVQVLLDTADGEENLGAIRAVEWNLNTAEMTITTEVGAPA